MRILVVEDDEQLASRISARLRGAGFAVDVVRSCADGQNWPEMERLDAVILDLGLPDGNGLDLLRGWRARKVACPVLILTAKGSWQDKVEGLNAGADDFVVKPVRFEELVARLHALMRRHGGPRPTWLEADGVRLDPVSGEVRLDDVPLTLSRQEYRLLHLFLRRPGQILAQADIVEHLYDLESPRDSNAIEVLVSRLRRKIGADRIRTLRGLGYRFGA